MKLVQVIFQFQYTERIEALLRGQGIDFMSIYPLIDGWDADGKHDGSQAFPGHLTVVQAEVPEERLDALFDDLRKFREEKKTHRHLQALVLPVDRRL